MKRLCRFLAGRCLRPILLALITPIAGGLAESSAQTTAGSGWDWCGTQRVYEEKYRQRFGAAATLEPCGLDHPCDDPAIRDTWIPDGSEPIQQVRMVIHVLALDDGSNPFSTPEHVAGQVAQLNADFAQVGIEFVYRLNQINSTEWRNLQESEISAMKLATAVEPERFLNVWVTVVDFSYSFGTFPWSYDALEATGGIVMGHFHWVDLPNRVFAHEVGHTLGLYHTFHGVDEVDPCSECYEIPSANSSLVGDLCADTPPTPNNAGPCTDYPGNDPCSDEPWGYTMPENYMGYASQTCLDTFTPEQRARLRCWSNSVIDSWVIPFQVEANPGLGPAPLTVDFQATTHKTATGWHWDFGDGGGSEQRSPTHVFQRPGEEPVTVTMTTNQGVYVREFAGLVSAYADTLRFENSRFDFTRGQVHIYARNYLTLHQIEIPFVYSGEVDIRFDSVSAAGLRSETAGVGLVSLIENLDRASITVGSPVSPLEPGSGPVASLFFTLLQSGAGGVVPIDSVSYPRHALEFIASAGAYVPVVESGSITASCCNGVVGDINGDGRAEPTLADVSILIAHLFINGMPLDCLPEADINQSGGLNPTAADITISDVSTLVDHLFINKQELSDCF